jgi:magnesium transporter
MANWVDLLDPSERGLHDALPAEIHESALELLRAPARHGDEPRPRIEGQGHYVFGILLAAVAVREEDRVYYQDIDFVITAEELVTVRKTPENGEPFDLERVKRRSAPDDSPGMILYYLVDEAVEDLLDLVDALNEEVEELDDHIEEWSPEKIRRRVTDLRHDILHIRRTVSPTRDAIRGVVDNRADLADGTCFPREVEVAFASAYDKVLRASESLDYTRELVGSVRDHYMSKVSQDQNEVVKRLTAIASLLLVPTFIVGVYGQNFTYIPEINDWGGWGYVWSWALVITSTLVQLWYFRRKHWL